MNLAARIVGVAQRATICIGPETARRVEDRFAIRAIGERRLKNVRGEVMIYQVTEGLTGSDQPSPDPGSR